MKKSIFIFIIIMFSIVTSSHAFFGDANGDMYQEIEDLHIYEKVQYSQSPFDELAQSADQDAHYINILDVGDEALLARIHLIRSAQRAIYIQTFIWANDETGRYVIYELLEAAKRGVKVKIIVDRWTSPQVTKLVAFMSSAHPNLEMKTYNPPAQKINPSFLRLIPELALKFKKINRRMHNKVFIVDDKFAITGGRNYENDYYDRGVTRNFKDRDVLVIGPVARKMTDSFMQYWAFKLSVPSSDLLDVALLISKEDFEKFNGRSSFRLGDLFDELDAQASSKKFIKKTFVDEVFKVSKVKFVVDKPGKNDTGGLRGGGEATVDLAKILFKAKNTIIAQTPYLVLDHITVKGVQKLRKERPSLDILISSNSLAATDNIYAYSFSYKQKKLFVKDLKFRIFELKPVPQDIAQMMPRYPLDKQDGKDEELVDSLSGEKDGNTMESKKKHMCIHAKSFVVDDEVSWIGSFNLDPRSVHLNTEAGLVIWDRRVAKAMKENILSDMAPQNSWTIGKRKDVPVISLFSGFMGNVLQQVPLVDIWPFRFTASFELKDGKKNVPFYSKDFYDNYRSVGSFPEVGLSLKEIEIRLLKAFSGVMMPVI